MWRCARLSGSTQTEGLFASEQTFYRVFKKLTGITPIQYRKSNI